ncbi:MAG: hypothetical protein NC212_08605 [Staphylococcus sp.]|nr:hypothetical protein [Staphylococcus sp.]
MNNEDFVTYEIAVKLKELGFDWECYEFWDTSFCDDGTPVKTRRVKHEPKICVMAERNSILESMGSELITAPTIAKVQKWLREVHSISVEPLYNMVRQWNVIVCEIDNFGEALWAKIGLDTYESALSAGIEAALKLIEIDKTKKS